MAEHTWIISAGVHAAVDPASLGLQDAPSRVTEYKLSDIGRYLLAPGAFSIESRLMGCECDLKPSWRERLKRALPFRRGGDGRPDATTRRLVLARLFVSIPPLRDAHLAFHVERLRSLLKPFDPVVGEIAGLNLDRFTDIRGVCEDAGGHRTHIHLAGGLEAKRRYVLDNLLTCVSITLSQARIADGLYEMRGLSAHRYQPERRHRLLRFQVNGQFFAGLLNAAGTVSFWLEDSRPLNELLLLQQAIETNPVLKSSIESCLRGDGQALRLMINSDLKVDYSRNRLPQFYQDLFHHLKIQVAARKEVIRSLNAFQTGVSFSFVRQEGYGDPSPTTSLSVLHDVKALEPVRGNLPELYAAVDQRATLSEAGKYYLLETIKGRPDDERL